MNEYVRLDMIGIWDHKGKYTTQMYLKDVAWVFDQWFVTI